MIQTGPFFFNKIGVTHHVIYLSQVGDSTDLVGRYKKKMAKMAIFMLGQLDHADHSHARLERICSDSSFILFVVFITAGFFFLFFSASVLWPIEIS